MTHNLDFEKPIVELQHKIDELKKFPRHKKVDVSSEVATLEDKLTKLKKDIYAHLSPWQKVQIARHPQRPTTRDYIALMMKDFIPLAGDRLFGEDRAIIGGFARLEGRAVMVVGHQKGKDTKENIERNFGCAHPEGYRKAMRLMRLAQRCSIPVVCLVDTPGAYPGVGAEERGQAQAIAENIRDMFEISTPLVVTVIGEGGSGGALGIGVGDRVSMLEYAYYSVISPEGCAAILWKDSARREDASNVLKLTADDLLRLGIVDAMVAEPEGGAHYNPEQTAVNLKKSLIKHIDEVSKLSSQELLAQRYAKFRGMGVFKE